ncbi:hypothetical protein PGT21_001251 [Puccinia graminis f. sp. tritici]|uniref:Uncharacterized protein n=1 Tax=Puccinia graminis f. sp. tritici TaxID=56615 RepID=A0A5B0QH54_PUCGR|nr:hypothetical protein PGT21_001251 [Puccinia graminis f. sp. tritici]
MNPPNPPTPYKPPRTQPKTSGPGNPRIASPSQQIGGRLHIRPLTSLTAGRHHIRPSLTAGQHHTLTAKLTHHSPANNCESIELIRLTSPLDHTQLFSAFDLENQSS